MNEFKDTVVLAAFAVVLSTAWLLAWVAGVWFDTGSSLARGGLALVWLMVVGTTAWQAIHRATRSMRHAYRTLDTLSRFTPQDLASAAQTGQAPSLPEANPWSEIVQRITGTLLDTHEKCEAAEHQRAALEIRAQRNELRAEQIEAILNGLAEPVFAVDNYDELLLANPSARRLLNLDTQCVERRVAAQLVHCDKLLDLLTDTRRRKSTTTRSDEFELAGPDGRTRWYSVTASNLAAVRKATAESAAQGAVVVLRDISSQKAIQKRNAEFVSAVSHEMKTPLAGIKAYVEMLVDGDAEDEATQEEFLNVINSQADRLKRLIDNLLNLARIESGVVKVVKSTHSLNEILDEAYDVLRPTAEQKQIELVKDLSPMYLNVLVDRDQFLQAAINLLSNAIKYTHAGGTVTLRSRLIDTQVQFDVEDTGVGLSEEDCDKVFEKFYRVQKDKQMAPGTGLGLSLAKYIVEDVHGGRLSVKSTLGVGSTFTITLPSAGEWVSGE
jgi:two-component system phosphate regulon sensor histidine kinase PhoR